MDRNQAYHYKSGRTKRPDVGEKDNTNGTNTPVTPQYHRNADPDFWPNGLCIRRGRQLVKLIIDWSIAIQSIYYLIFGIIWIWPVKWLLKWMAAAYKDNEE